MKIQYWKVLRDHFVSEDDLGKAEQRELQRSQFLSNVMWTAGSRFFDNHSIWIFQLQKPSRAFSFQLLWVGYSATCRIKNHKGYSTIPSSQSSNFPSLPQSSVKAGTCYTQINSPEVPQKSIYTSKCLVWGASFACIIHLLRHPTTPPQIPEPYICMNHKWRSPKSLDRIPSWTCPIISHMLWRRTNVSFYLLKIYPTY